MSTIALRIKELIDIKKLNISSFEKKIGVGNNSIGTIIKRNSNVSGDILSKILTTFNDVNIEYLLTGKGKILHNEYLQKEEPLQTVKEPQQEYFEKGTNYDLLKQQNELYKKNAELYKEQAEIYKEKYENCEKEKKSIIDIK